VGRSSASFCWEQAVRTSFFARSAFALRSASAFSAMLRNAEGEIMELEMRCAQDVRVGSAHDHGEGQRARRQSRAWPRVEGT
jgi:hypothetical protein